MNILWNTSVRRSGAGRPGQGRKLLALLVLVGFCHLAVVPAGWAAKEDSQDTASEAGLGVASVLLSIPYGCAKVAYAIVGGITGGFTYIFTGGNLKAAQSVWDTSLRGTYIITPEHLRGEKPVRFLGIPAEGEAPRNGGGRPSSEVAPQSPPRAAADGGTQLTPSEPSPSLQAGPVSPAR